MIKRETKIQYSLSTQTEDRKLRRRSIWCRYIVLQTLLRVLTTCWTISSRICLIFESVKAIKRDFTYALVKHTISQPTCKLHKSAYTSIGSRKEEHHSIRI